MCWKTIFFSLDMECFPAKNWYSGKLPDILFSSFSTNIMEVSFMVNTVLYINILFNANPYSSRFIQVCIIYYKLNVQIIGFWKPSVFSDAIYKYDFLYVFCLLTVFFFFFILARVRFFVFSVCKTAAVLINDMLKCGKNLNAI